MVLPLRGHSNSTRKHNIRMYESRGKPCTKPLLETLFCCLRSGKENEAAPAAFFLPTCCSLGLPARVYLWPPFGRDLLLVRIGLGFVYLFSYLLPPPAAARYLLSRFACSFIFFSSVVNTAAR